MTDNTREARQQSALAVVASLIVIASYFSGAVGFFLPLVIALVVGVPSFIVLLVATLASE